MRYLMACGHVSNATDEFGNPICVLCHGIRAVGSIPIKEIDGNTGLEGRKARCVDCRKETDSNWGLPFFEYRPNHEYDKYYCGCEGWD
jgi:hypothetical protein